MEGEREATDLTTQRKTKLIYKRSGVTQRSNGSSFVNNTTCQCAGGHAEILPIGSKCIFLPQPWVKAVRILWPVIRGAQKTAWQTHADPSCNWRASYRFPQVRSSFYNQIKTLASSWFQTVSGAAITALK